MRRTTALYLIFVLLISLLMNGCNNTDDSKVKTSDKVPVPAESESTDYYEGTLVLGSDKEGPTENHRDTSQSIEQYADDEIFSDRDLNCNPDLSSAVEIPAENDSSYTVSSAGTYLLNGKASNFTVTVEADKNEDKVQIVLKDVSISNDNSPVIYVKSADKCFITSIGENTISVSGNYKADGETNTDAAIFSKDDITLNGSGSLTVESVCGNGISVKDDLKITGGKYNISCAYDAVEVNDSISVYDGEFNINTEKDAFHCENDKLSGSIYIKGGSFSIIAQDDGIQATSLLEIDGGDFNITASEGLEATYIKINGGSINITASDDGINASAKSNDYDVVIEINDGSIKVVAGPGDTDCIDSNGTIIVNGGTVDVTGTSTFDADIDAVYNGGTLIINGVKTDSIPISMMDQPGGMGKSGGMRGPGEMKVPDEIDERQPNTDW